MTISFFSGVSVKSVDNLFVMDTIVPYKERCPPFRVDTLKNTIYIYSIL